MNSLITELLLYLQQNDSPSILFVVSCYSKINNHRDLRSPNMYTVVHSRHHIIKYYFQNKCIYNIIFLLCYLFAIEIYDYLLFFLINVGNLVFTLKSTRIYSHYSYLMILIILL